jgi:hypothetical protein
MGVDLLTRGSVSFNPDNFFGLQIGCLREKHWCGVVN